MHLTHPEPVQSITGAWNDRRDANSWPLVPADILKRLAPVTTEEAWGYPRGNGYPWQLAGGFTALHPEETMSGRAVICQLVPRRPDVHEAIARPGEEDMRVGFQNSWVIDELTTEDVLVVDIFGKIKDGTFAGDNLSTAIEMKTGRGLPRSAGPLGGPGDAVDFDHVDVGDGHGVTAAHEGVESVNLRGRLRTRGGRPRVPRRHAQGFRAVEGQPIEAGGPPGAPHE
ncbi:MAG: hypothetical protein FJ314_04150 [SAR202 cluster bacterium]|nr:hypothetical protein [SAR202 cluster bacterium]